MTETITKPDVVLSDGWNQLAAQVPGAVWQTDEKRYVLPWSSVTPRTATIVLKVLPALAVERPELLEVQAQGAHDIRPVDHSKRLKLTVDTPLVDEALAEKGHSMYDFQRWDIAYLTEVIREHGGAYCGWQRGMGKTMCGFAVREALGAKRTLVVAGNTAKHVVWEDEAVDYVRDGTRVAVIPNTKAKREEFLKDLYARRGEPIVLIVHYESVAIVAGKSGRGWDKFGTWDLVICDEAHRIKNAGARVSRSVKKIPSSARLALSGSIIENHAEELFSQLQWLFPTRYRSKWRDWNLRFLDYIENGAYGKLFVGVRQDALKQLQEELGVFMVYRRRREEVECPNRIDKTIEVALSPKQKRVYDDLVAECLAELDDGSFVAAQDGLPLMGKLRQVATGLDLVGNVADSTKLDLAVEIANDTDDAVLIFGWYKESLKALERRLGEDQCVRIDGDITGNRRTEAIRKFQRGDVRILLGTISTIGESMNFQRANHAILIDRAWNPMKNEQAEDRVDRFGQEKDVYITHIVAKDTVDSLRVAPVLASKDALRRSILGG